MIEQFIVNLVNVISIKLVDAAFPVFKRLLSSVSWGMIILKVLPLLVLIAIIIGGIKLGLFASLVKVFTKEESPPWREYTEMFYKGYLIKWEYEPFNLSVLCPKCRCRVTRKFMASSTYCPLCGTYFEESLFEEDFGDIRKIIERNIRMGDYPKG